MSSLPYNTVTLFHGFTALRTFSFVRHARSVEERKRGVIGLLKLEENEAMVLHFQQPTSPVITNENVDFPIAVLFVDEFGRVLGRNVFEARSPFVKAYDGVSAVIEMPISAKSILPITTYAR